MASIKKNTINKKVPAPKKKKNEDILVDALQKVYASKKDLSIMFIDLCGSTALKEKLKDEAWVACIHCFITLISKAIKKYKGDVVKTIGDEVMAVFDNPKNAILFIIDFYQTQQNIQSFFTKHKVNAYCKIACDYGTVLPYSTKDYISITIDRCARIAKLCPEDSILFSEKMYGFYNLYDDLKERLYTVEHPKIKLKGIKKLINIYSVFPDENTAKRKGHIIAENITDRDRKLLENSYRINRELAKQFYRLTEEMRNKKLDTKGLREETSKILKKTIDDMKGYICEKYLEDKDAKVNICIKSIYEKKQDKITKSFVCTDSRHDEGIEYKIFYNTDFKAVYDLVAGNIGTPIYVERDLKKLGDNYINEDINWENKYDSVIIASIGYEIISDNQDRKKKIYGFLCIDALKNNKFKNSIEIIKNYTGSISKGILYLFEKYEHFSSKEAKS